VARRARSVSSASPSSQLQIVQNSQRECYLIQNPTAARATGSYCRELCVLTQAFQALTSAHMHHGPSDVAPPPWL